MYIYVYIHIYRHMYIFIYIYIYVHIRNIYMYKYNKFTRRICFWLESAYAYMYTFKCTHSYVHIYMCTHEYMYINIHTYVYKNAYKYTEFTSHISSWQGYPVIDPTPVPTDFLLPPIDKK
jgi:hypothetical protein